MVMTPPPSTSTPTAPTLDAIERTTLNDMAYERLKQALLTGRIETGMILTFRQLAQDLGTSMMPVREAVARLVAERALEVLPQRGIRVPQLTVEEFEDLWTLRKQLESEGAARAALRATPEDIEKISTLRDRIRDSAEAGDLYDFLADNSAFQIAICQAAQTRVFITLVEMLRAQASPHRNDAVRALLAERPPYYHQMFRNHEALVDAIARHDEYAAREIRGRDIQEFRAFSEQLARR